jgi:hypothetical protein
MDHFDLAIRRRFDAAIRDRSDMHFYQEECVEFMLANPFSAVFIDLGMGKTVSSLTVIADLISNLDTEKVLVIGPVKVVTDTWPTEVEQWRHVAWLNWTLIRAEGGDAGQNELERERLARLPTSVHFINREMVEWLVYFWKDKWPYRTVFIDECFIAGTRIHTPSGNREIQTLAVGDLVCTPYGDRAIRNVIRKRSESVIKITFADGSTVSCTPDHRFFTDAGWCRAADLKGRLVYGQSDFASMEMWALHGDILDMEVSPEVLQSFVRETGIVGERKNGACGGYSHRAQSVQDGSYSLEQRPPVAERDSSKDGEWHHEKSVSSDQRRQWHRNVKTRSDARRNADFWLDLQLRGHDRCVKGLGGSVSLQNRFRVASGNDCLGSGRFESRLDQTSTGGPQERGMPYGTRVVRVSSDERRGSTDVFDISVDGAPYYFAEGHLVHNCSSFKDHKSKRFKALAKVRNTDGLIDRLHILTATPAAENYIHLFPQIWLLDRGQRLGKNITSYREEHFTYNKWSMKWKLRPGSEETILNAIADISVVMKKKDYLKSAEPTIVHHKVRLEAKQLELIGKLERHFLIRLPDGTEIEAKTAAMMSSMLLQMASGTVYETLLVEDFDTDDLKKVKKVHNIHDHKIATLKEVVEEAQTQGTNLLVAYHFQSSLAKLRKAFPKATVMDKEGKCIKDWNAGKIPMLLIHPQSAGHGLNLQHGGHTLIFYDMIYSLENYLQTIGRLDRQGQLNPVTVIMLIAEGTRDELVAGLLKEKQDAQEALFRILKRLIAKLRKERAAVN